VTEALRVAVAEPLSALGLYFERLIGEAGHTVWCGDKSPPDVVLLGLDGPDREWTLSIEAWLASGALVIATSARTEAFTLIEDRDDSTLRLLRPFTPTRLRQAITLAGTLLTDAVTVAANGDDPGRAETLSMSDPLGAPPVQAVSQVDLESLHELPPDALEVEPNVEVGSLQSAVPGPNALKPEATELRPERVISADLIIIDDEMLLSEALEIRIAEAIADSVQGLASLDSRDATIATLRYLIQTA
jgi:hypothetical protein